MANSSFGIFDEWDLKIVPLEGRAVGNLSRTKETSTTWQIYLKWAVFMFSEALLEEPTDTSHKGRHFYLSRL